MSSCITGLGGKYRREVLPVAEISVHMDNSLKINVLSFEDFFYGFSNPPGKFLIMLNLIFEPIVLVMESDH